MVIPKAISEKSLNILSKLIEVNTSNIEKMETRYKISRMISAVTIFPIVLTLIIVGAFYATLYFNTVVAWIVVVGFAIYLTFTVKLNKKKTVFKNLVVVMLIVFIFSFCSFEFSLIFTYISSGFVFTELPIHIIVASLLYIFCYGLYFTISDMVLKKRNNFKRVTLEIQTIGNEPQLFELVNITRKGDYIVNNVEIDSTSRQEVLINRANVVKITIVSE